jgi:hypothetical protein
MVVPGDRKHCGPRSSCLGERITQREGVLLSRRGRQVGLDQSCTDYGIAGLHAARSDGFPRREAPGDWRVEYFDEDGAGYVTIFAGPWAETRARDYFEAAVTNLLMHDQESSAYGEQLAEQIIEQFKDADELAALWAKHGDPEVAVWDEGTRMPRARPEA